MDDNNIFQSSTTTSSPLANISSNTKSQTTMVFGAVDNPSGPGLNFGRQAPADSLFSVGQLSDTFAQQTVITSGAANAPPELNSGRQSPTHSLLYSADASTKQGTPITNQHLQFPSPSRPDGARYMLETSTRFRIYIIADSKPHKTEVEGGLIGLFSRYRGRKPLSKGQGSPPKIAAIHIETGELIVSSPAPINQEHTLFILRFIMKVCQTVGVDPPSFPPFDEYRRQGTLPMLRPDADELEMLSTATGAMNLDETAHDAINSHKSPEAQQPYSTISQEWHKKWDDGRAELRNKRCVKAKLKTRQKKEAKASNSKMPSSQVGQMAKQREKRRSLMKKLPGHSKRLKTIACHDGDAEADSNDLDMDMDMDMDMEGGPAKAGNSMLPAQDKTPLCVVVQTNHDQDLEMAE